MSAAPIHAAPSTVHAIQTAPLDLPPPPQPPMSLPPVRGSNIIEAAPNGGATPLAPHAPGQANGCQKGTAPAAPAPTLATLLAQAESLVGADLIATSASLASTRLTRGEGLAKKDVEEAFAAAFQAVQYRERLIAKTAEVFTPGVLKELSDFAATADGKLCLQTQERLRCIGAIQGICRRFPAWIYVNTSQRAWMNKLEPHFAELKLNPQHQQTDALRHLVLSLKEAELTTLEAFLRSPLGTEYKRGERTILAWSQELFAQDEYTQALEAKLKPLVETYRKDHPGRAARRRGQALLIERRSAKISP